MNNGRRTGGAAVVIGLALLTAACGGSSTSTVAAGATAYTKALAYSECVRAHGLPNFPDPDSNGAIQMTANDHVGSGAQLNSAAKACQHLDPFGQLSPARLQQALSQGLKFAACMRSHGFPDFPDPVVANGGIERRLPPGTNPNSPQFQSADKTCGKLVSGGGL